MKKMYFTAQEISELIGVSRSQAYKIIQNLNVELEAKGFITVQGKIPKKYFAERYYGDIDELGGLI
jgi:sugar-specific transcriptional regulator TrmB